MPTGAAIVASTLIGAGASAITARKQEKANEKVRAEQKRQRDIDLRSKIKSEKLAVESAKSARKLKEGKAASLRNISAARKGIAPRGAPSVPFGSAVSDAILNEG